MNTYRICKTQYAHDMSGLGARLTGGRWNTAGHPILYTSENSALAAFELATHVSLSILPDDLSLVTYSIPSDLSIDEVTNLPNHWDNIPPNDQTRKIGDNFILHAQAPILKVPSVVIKGAFNYLINPNNTGSQLIKIESVNPFSFDQRFQSF